MSEHRCLRCGDPCKPLRALCPICVRAKRNADRRDLEMSTRKVAVASREEERALMRERLARIRAERSAKQRRAMGLPA